VLYPLNPIEPESLLLLSRQAPGLKDTHQVLQTIVTGEVFLVVVERDAALIFFVRAAGVAKLGDPGSDVVAIHVVVNGLLDGIEYSGFSARIVTDASAAV